MSRSHSRLNDLWRPYAAIGDLATARGSLEEATPIWRELGNLPMLSENLASLGTLRWLAGDDAGRARALRGGAQDLRRRSATSGARRTA